CLLLPVVIFRLPFSCLLLIRRPPRPPLFPYTTLFRSALAFLQRSEHSLERTDLASNGSAHTTQTTDTAGIAPPGIKKPQPCRQRSEEHTSELQSRENLVCRLLLEKKNNTPQGRP